ncbi:PD-(D/E)XK nuclease family protein [Anaerolineae bacterium AMX1]|nr:PD-(D/E)XK nuclease family protein [Anaerolineae bacterium AMX1]
MKRETPATLHLLPILPAGLLRLSAPLRTALPRSRLAEGSFFHRLAQQHLLGLPADKLTRLAASPDLSRWWDNFQRDFGDPRELGSLRPETILSAPVLIAVRDDGVTIYDWKTYHKRPKNEWMAARMQTRVYRYLLARAGAYLNGGRPFAPESIQMVYWYADYPSEPAVFRYDAAQFKRDGAAIEKLIGEIESLEKFELTGDEGKCRFCAYRSYCNRGVTAGDWKDAEAEAEVHEAFDVNFEQIAEIVF